LFLTGIILIRRHEVTSNDFIKQQKQTKEIKKNYSSSAAIQKKEEDKQT